jgi:hypothetical protein
MQVKTALFALEANKHKHHFMFAYFAFNFRRAVRPNPVFPIRTAPYSFDTDPDPAF